jgi:hypothetical protein
MFKRIGRRTSFKTGIYLMLLFLFAGSCNNKIIDYTSIAGSWRVQEVNPLSGTRVYIVEIDRSKSDTTQYLIRNFYDADINEFVFAQLRGSTLSLPDQTISNVRIKSGTGTVNKNYTSIEFDYNIYDGNDTRVHGSFTRPK